ncbi:hypothetical protein M378DRAFT_18661 [Amanita muscaria Koide BX008]|uniref:Uncharacterized protein n=1 Tax=Amanita muscaria (strain Koide BX008) TaxID=946122 RepID=A0A0C2WDL8_AMAMK|nr:hypothetical protein M378DRAFT_18661 [Amanita muscaria Koide BX008]
MLASLISNFLAQLITFLFCAYALYQTPSTVPYLEAIAVVGTLCLPLFELRARAVNGVLMLPVLDGG